MRKIKSFINYFLIVIFIVLGFIGLLLPFIPQVIFFAIAIILLSFEIPAVEKYISENLKKDSLIGKIYYPLRDKFHKYFG